MKLIWKIFNTYLLIIFFILICNNAFGQKICKQDVCVVEFNASWNEQNQVTFLDKLKDCGIVRINIDEGDYKKYNITVVPTIIVFNGKEVERFKADLSFKATAKLEDVQEVVNEINMKRF
jgi:hypothetical protein|tara:strand:+ start:242 stop:601 length:360 start_codon:yes stop_codon:yes gene_type:complete